MGLPRNFDQSLAAYITLYAARTYVIHHQAVSEDRFVQAEEVFS